MTHLADQQCEPCRGGEPPIEPTQAELFLKQLDGWRIVDGHHLVKRYETPDFVQALDLVNRFGAIAEELGHHPVLEFSWGWVEARIWTHKIDGLHLADFVLAARYDRASASGS